MAHPLPHGATPTPRSVDVVRQVVRGSRAADLWRAGRHAAAERVLRDVAAALIRRNAPAPAADALIALGRLMLERGRASDAAALFAEAGGLGEIAGDRQLSAGARIWEAAGQTDAAQLTLAERLCRAVPRVEIGAAERARADATLARILLWQGRVDEAAACHLRPPGEDPEADAFVVGTHIRVRLEMGDVFEAGRCACELAELSNRSASVMVTVLALTAQTRVALATGDLGLGGQCIERLRLAARTVRAPLRLARARLLWVDALRRVGRRREAERELVALGRLRVVAPPLFRLAVERRLADRPAIRPSRPGARHRDITALVALGSGADDESSVAQVLLRAAEMLGARRIEVCGPGGATLVATGSGPSTRLAEQVLVTGQVVDGDDGAPGGELGLPVRCGTDTVAALAAAWPTSEIPGDARELLELVAALLAPRIEGVRTLAARQAAASDSMPELAGSSPAIEGVRQAVSRAARAPFATLIEGESGSGKELVARALHRLSVRGSGRFCDVNCAALPDELLESELFGHARGAFTGAATDRPGLIEEAGGGTLFLDEVSDLSLRAQAKLLRVLQQREVRRVGESVSRPVDLRVVSAANRDLRAEVETGRFRQDLLYRLDVVRIRVPPLRERREDVPELVRQFWSLAAESVGTRARLPSALVTALLGYDWPGNVRELQNVVAALAVAAPSSGPVPVSLLPVMIVGARSSPLPRLDDLRRACERRAILDALDRVGGRRAAAARALGLSRQGLLKLMARLGLDPSDGHRSAVPP